MKIRRRELLGVAAGAAVLAGVPKTAQAQRYPARPVRLVVAWPAAGVTDITARLIGESLSERFAQRLIIENRAGASGIIGTEAVVRSVADGYTLLMVTTANAIEATLHEKLPYNFIHDIVPVASLTQSPNVLVVNPACPAKSVPEFIDWAKANPDGLNVASAGNGTSQHLAAELFNMMAGVKMRHVPYRGSAMALTDLLGGQVQVMFAPVASSIKHVTSNKLRALGVTSASRLTTLSDLPPLSDYLPGYECTAWYGIGAPRHTAPEIVSRLNAEVGAVLNDPRIQARLVEVGATPFTHSPSEFRRFIIEETQRWAKVVKFAGMKPE